jgi:phage protein D
VIEELTIAGTKVTGSLAEAVAVARVDDDVSQTSELAVDFVDEDGKIADSGLLAKGNVVRWSASTQSYAIAVVEFSQAGGSPAVSRITARPKSITTLRTTRGPRGFKKGTPSSAATELAASVSLKSVVEPSAARADVAVNGPSEGERAESYWDAIQRWAGDIGFVAFEAGGTLYFGRPTWLVDRTPTRTLSRKDPLIYGITLRTSEDDETEPATVDLTVDPALAKVMPPGSGVTLTDAGPWNGKYWVSRRSGEFAGLPWEISLVVPTDPKPADTDKAAKPGAKAGASGFGSLVLRSAKAGTVVGAT